MKKEEKATYSRDNSYMEKTLWETKKVTCAVSNTREKKREK